MLPIIAPLLLSPALYFSTPTGAKYHTVNELPQGACVMEGTEELVFTAENFNTCNEILLEPGCYRAELSGGIGAPNPECLDHVEPDFTTYTSALFSISEPTTVYALRGGDGNPGQVITSGSSKGSFGGGASGVDCILVVGNNTWRAPGGAGKSCISASSGSATNQVPASTTVKVGNGFGGNTTNLAGHINGYRSFSRTYSSTSNKYINSIGGGGGGAPEGIGGTKWQFNKNNNVEGVIVNPGEDATPDAGGNGGDVTSYTEYDLINMISVVGGRGGKTVSYSCGGQTATTYGGGGGGASVSSNYKKGINGGDGGSGSTGTSEISFIRIYKI